MLIITSNSDIAALKSHNTVDRNVLSLISNHGTRQQTEHQYVTTTVEFRPTFKSLVHTYNCYHNSVHLSICLSVTSFHFLSTQ